MNNNNEKRKNNKEIAERIKKLRIQKGVSQKEFAKLVNLHPVQYNRYEKGENTPTTDTLAKIADELGVSVDYLYDGEKHDAAIANLEDKDLLKMFEELEKLPTKDKEIAKEMLDSFLFKRRIQKQLAS